MDLSLSGVDAWTGLTAWQLASWLGFRICDNEFASLCGGWWMSSSSLWLAPLLLVHICLTWRIWLWLHAIRVLCSDHLLGTLLESLCAYPLRICGGSVDSWGFSCLAFSILNTTSHVCLNGFSTGNNANAPHRFLRLYLRPLDGPWTETTTLTCIVVLLVWCTNI